MQATISFGTVTVIAVLGAALSASVLAQSDPAPGPGARGMRQMRFDHVNTSGWTMMTAQERRTHRNRMHDTNTFEECKQVQAEHHAAMEARAKEQGLTLRAPRQNACDMAKARGWLK